MSGDPGSLSSHRRLKECLHLLVALCDSDDGASPTFFMSSSSSVLGLRGLGSKAEVIQFFGEISVKAVVLGRKGGAQGRSFNGEAFVELDPTDAARALEKLHLSSFGSRYVECVMAQEKSEPQLQSPHPHSEHKSLVTQPPCTPE